MAITTHQILSEELLARCEERAPICDRENRFFQKDFDELREAGYLGMNVPTELGGLGLSLAEVFEEQRRLAYHAAPTALAVNMHLYWTGVAADLWRNGDTSLEWLLKAAIDGEVFAVGHSESGNDMPLLYSTTQAERVDGDNRFTGRKSFGSLGPAWTFLGLHGIDTSDPESPKIVHAFMPRGSEGCTTEDTWDTLGMRATRSDDTVLQDVFVPDQYIVRVVPASAAGIDYFILAIFAWAEPMFYYAIAQRAFDWTIANVKKKTSLAMSRSMAYHAEVQHSVAAMALALKAIGPHIKKIAQDWSNGVEHGAMWGAKLVAVKHHAVEGAWRVVDTALDLAGGSGIFKHAGLERLFRDARLGRIHPANSALTHEFVAKTVLGIDIDEKPRWG